MNERALVMSGCDYVDGRHMTRERIDQVVTKMKEDGQIPEALSLNTDLARSAFAAGLKPIYKPFHHYVLHDIHCDRVPARYYRNGRNTDDAVIMGFMNILWNITSHKMMC
jgi:hypothetical protein